MLVKIALKNLLNTGIRLWINVLVITISICIVLWIEAIYAGFADYSINAVKSTEAGYGQLISPGFDPDDPLTWLDNKSPIPKAFEKLVEQKKIYPLRFSPATLYFKEKNMRITIKSIPHGQDILDIKVPDGVDFHDQNGAWPVTLGAEMAEKIKCQKNDIFTMTWKNSSGAYDAADFSVQTVIKTGNPRVENMSVWVDRKIFEILMDESSLVSYMVLGPNAYEIAKKSISTIPGWKLKSADELTDWIRDLEQKKRKNTKLVYLLLVFLCSIGLFNSQITAVFKRRKEIGMLMAMGLTNLKISLIFAFEGVITAVFALILTPLIGSPLFYWSSVYGMSASHTKGMGMPLPKRLKAVYSLSTGMNTMIFFLLILTIVSWLPVHRILSYKPAELVNRK